MTKSFKIGDRVKIITSLDKEDIGTLGTIRDIWNETGTHWIKLDKSILNMRDSGLCELSGYDFEELELIEEKDNG